MPESRMNQNERSSVIELISKINAFVLANDLVIKHAGGERTITSGRTTMFPDVILYGDRNQQVFLQGWEAKMPDVSIDDETFIKDAQRKAVALNLNSCLIWNFTYAALYLRGEDGVFRRVRFWSETSFIQTRVDVDIHREEWLNLVEKILLEINQYFLTGEFRKSSVGESISKTTLSSIIERNKSLVADTLRQSTVTNSVIDAYLGEWWRESKIEYQHDEQDKYAAYAKIVILNWVNRILFAHVIKPYQNGARLVENITSLTSPTEANQIFQAITEQCDFFNVFSGLQYNDILPTATWRDFVDLSLFLLENGIASIDQNSLQNILEETVGITKRELNGQYATPEILANILVEMTIRDWSDHVVDPCCGTGTIARSVLSVKRERIGIRDAMATLWAFDKNKFPLQVANISMTRADTINLPAQISVQNIFSLEVGNSIEVVNPDAGGTIDLDLPNFGSIVVNLPFVAFELIAKDDKDIIRQDALYDGLNGRSDLYCYAVLKLSRIIKPGGFLGIITSNAWMGTKAGADFVKEVKKHYDILQVHISGNGRWFQNADVIATILILKKKDNHPEDSIKFFSWQKPLGFLETNQEARDKLIRSALLSRELDGDVVKVTSYTHDQVTRLHSNNISYNAFFHKIDWIEAVEHMLIPLNNVYDVFRGCRRGWDELFYPCAGEHNIERTYLRKVLKTARNVDRLTAVADADAFCCAKSLGDLRREGHEGAIAWIERFSHEVNGTGRPLPEVLKKNGMQWYELQENEVAEVFTMMNPDRRFFFAKFETPSFINQRLIGFRHRSMFQDEELNHALLNSAMTMFFIEAAGFGRGLGVLDISKKALANCRMFDPRRVSGEHRTSILSAFARLKSRAVKDVQEELYQEDRIEFEKAVFSGFGIEEEYFKNCRSSLLSMQTSRHAIM